MPFKKGKSGNEAGRPTGSKNLLSGELREKTAEEVYKRIGKVFGLFDELKPLEQVKLLPVYMEFVMAKLKSVEGNVTIDFLSDEAVDQVASNIALKYWENKFKDDEKRRIKEGNTEVD